MNIGKVLGGIRKVLTKLTDALLWGRNKGLWTQGPGPNVSTGGRGQPLRFTGGGGSGVIKINRSALRDGGVQVPKDTKPGDLWADVTPSHVDGIILERRSRR